MSRTYTVVLDPDPEEGGYTVTVPALPGVVTQGETVDQCIERVQPPATDYRDKAAAART